MFSGGCERGIHNEWVNLRFMKLNNLRGEYIPMSLLTQHASDLNYLIILSFYDHL